MSEPADEFEQWLRTRDNLSAEFEAVLRARAENMPEPPNNDNDLEAAFERLRTYEIGR